MISIVEIATKLRSVFGFVIAERSVTGGIELLGPDGQPIDVGGSPVSISGTFEVGETLTATLSAGWSAGGYQWTRDGSNISGATGATYVLQSADAGKSVTCKVSGLVYGPTGQTVAGSVTPEFAPIVLSVAPTAFYSVGRLSTYSGPVLEADGTTDVAFVGNKLPDMSGAVSKLYDQSGNGHHATQATSANRPLIHATGKIGSVQALTFDGANSGTTRNRELGIPSSLVLPTKNCTMIFVGRPTTSNAANGFFGAANSDGVSADLLEYKVFLGLAGKGTAANQTMATYPPVQPTALCISSDASNSRFYQQNKSQSRTAFATAANSAGGRIGNVSTANHRGTFQMLAMAIYTPALTDAQIAVAMGELRTAFGIVNQFDTQLILDGDSNMEGTGTSLCQNTPIQLQPLLSHAVQMHNFGNFGNTLQAIATSGAARFTPGSGWTLDAPGRKIYVQAAGINDVIGARTSAQMIADAQTNITAAVAAGYQHIICTIPPATSVSGAKETVRQEYNTHIRANYATMGCAAVADFAADVRLQNPADTNYYDEGLHHGNGGNLVKAQVLAAVINQLIA